MDTLTAYGPGWTATLDFEGLAAREGTSSAEDIWDDVTTGVYVATFGVVYGPYNAAMAENALKLPRVRDEED